MTSRVELLTGGEPAAIGVVRLRGERTADFLTNSIRLRGKADVGQLRRGDIRRIQLLDAGEPIDDGLLSVHAVGPEWDVRVHLHGSPWILQRCVELAVEAGFADDAAGAADLWPADSAIERDVWAALPAMQTEAGITWLMRQREVLPRELGRILAEFESAPDDANVLKRLAGECGAIADGFRVFRAYAKPTRIVLLGPPNAGKSTLANALAERNVAIVSPVAGTTRDWNEIPGEAGGFPVTWIDTAGVRAGADSLEREGIRRTLALAAGGAKVVLVLDATADASTMNEFTRAINTVSMDVTVVNKCDSRVAPPSSSGEAIPVSAIVGTGLDTLRQVLSRQISSMQAHNAAAFTETQFDILRLCEREFQNVNHCSDRLRTLIGA